jgi:Na+-driven multidrug efflux pump
VPFPVTLALAQPALQSQLSLAGAHRDAGDTWTPLLAAAFGNRAIRVAIASVLASVWHAPLHWIWLAILGDHHVRVAWLAASFARGRWLCAPAGSSAAA